VADGLAVQVGVEVRVGALVENRVGMTMAVQLGSGVRVIVTVRVGARVLVMDGTGLGRVVLVVVGVELGPVVLVTVVVTVWVLVRVMDAVNDGVMVGWGVLVTVGVVLRKGDAVLVGVWVTAGVFVMAAVSTWLVDGDGDANTRVGSGLAVSLWTAVGMARGVIAAVTVQVDVGVFAWAERLKRALNGEKYLKVNAVIIANMLAIPNMRQPDAILCWRVRK